MRKRRRPLELRDYQVLAVSKVAQELVIHKSTLLAMSTGTGKTHTFLAWLESVLSQGQRALIIAHRRELIYQPMERMKQFFPALYRRAGIVMAERRDTDADVIVATVQSLNAEGRINEILAHGKIDYIITDEAHHAISDTYENLYARLYEANPNMKHLGCTATPRRADDVALKDVYESVAYRLPLNKAIEMGALVPFVAMGFYVETVKLDHIPQYKGDWSNEKVGTAMTEKAVLDTAVAKWKEHAAGRPTIAFCATIAQADRMAQWFRDAGVKAEAANYKTNKKERADILRRFESGETTVICNAMLWTEGVDLPMAEVALMLRPTRSDSLYVQMVGRVLRTWAGKVSALIMDFVPAEARHMIMAGDLLDGRPKPERKAEEKAIEQGVLLDCFGIDKKGKGIDGDPDAVFMKVLNYFTASTLAWTKAHRLATVGLSDTRTLCVVGPDMERIEAAEAIMDTDAWTPACERVYNKINVYKVYAIEQDKLGSGKKGPKRLRNLGTFPDWDSSVETTEEYAADNTDATLARRKKKWRTLAPTDGQIKFANRLGIPKPATMRRGEIAQAITHKLALDLLERKRLLKIKRLA